MALTIGLAEAKNNFSKLTSEVNRSGRSVTILKNNKPWVVISPATNKTIAESQNEMVDIAVDFMDEYADVFQELAK